MKQVNNLNSSFETDRLKDIFNTEWLETNGLGTWAASSVSGINTNRNHGLLIAKNKQGKTFSILAKLEETLIYNQTKFNLSANQYPGALYPNGYQYLKSFSKTLFPEFIFQVEGITIRKTITAVHGEQAIIILYELIEGPESIQMSLLPLITSRAIDELTYQNDTINPIADFSDNTFSHQAYHGNPTLHMSFSNASYKPKAQWYNSFEYETQHKNGEFFREDMFSPGEFLVNLQKNQSLGIVISDSHHNSQDIYSLFEQEFNRRNKLSSEVTSNYERQLRLAADQFIIKNNDSLYIKSGYFENAVRSRENVLSISGLLISTGRFKEAKELLLNLKSHFKKGLLPDDLELKKSGFNSADTSLWYFESIYQYFKHTEDTDFIFNEIMPLLKDIIAWFLKGTNNNICVDTDGLIIAGTSDVPATWMNARSDGWAITPRAGKAVEINALWFNALKIYAYFLDLSGKKSEVNVINDLTDNIKKRFKEVFWNKSSQSLFDLVDENNIINDRIRPNQLFAISLSFPVLSEKKAKHVLDTVEKKLVTDYGIKTLSAEAMGFRPKYEGNIKERKLAYHEGTVWNWLTGAYIDALIKLQGKAGKAKAKVFFSNFVHHLETACYGSISEIFNATDDHTPNGIGAYALSVAEILRVGIKYNLFESQDLNKLTDEEREILGYLENEDVKLSSYLKESDNEIEEDYEIVDETETEEYISFSNPFSVISAFRSPGTKFSRLFSLYNFG